MTDAKESENRVIVHLPIWVRVLGGFCALGCGGLSYLIAQGIGEDTKSLVLLICVGLPFTFLGIFFLGYTSQFIFNHTLENMTIRTGIGPFIYRIRHIPKREVLTCWVSEETAEGPGVFPVTLWQVSLKISGREKGLKIIVNNKKMADYLVNKIRAFS